jgi:hypothetical protein
VPVFQRLLRLDAVFVANLFFRLPALSSAGDNVYNFPVAPFACFLVQFRLPT